MASTRKHIVVIGAGMAGLACARQLTDAGRRVVVLDKGRGIGGRMASRRLENGLSFDHGAQFATARTPEFQSLLSAAAGAGHAATWNPLHDNKADVKWIGVPGMSAIPRFLGRGLDIRQAATVIQVIRAPDGAWQILLADGQVIEASAVVSTVPAPQAMTLLAAEPVMAGQLASVDMAPCWAVMLAFETRLPTPVDAIKTKTDLAWIARNSSKPGRTASLDGWVIHASPEWSRRHLELSADDAARELLDRLPAALELAECPTTIYCAAHRWRYALATRALGRPFVASPDRTLYIGGDWCLGPRVEAAVTSGRAIAADIIGAS